MKAQHTPAAMRKKGFTAYKYYLVGGLFAVLYIYLFSTRIWKKLVFANNSETLLFILLFGAVLGLLLNVVFGSKVSPIRIPHFNNWYFLTGILSILYLLFHLAKSIHGSMGDTKIFSLAGLAAFALIFEWLYNKADKYNEHIVTVIVILANIGVFVLLWHKPNRHFSSIFWMVVPPFLLFLAPMLKMVIAEYIKEHPFYRRLFILGRRGESARWAGFYDYFQKDISGFFAKNRNRIDIRLKSMIYFGRTFFENDTRIGGRHLGSTSEQHMITVAGTGAGKSRDAIWNTLLSYSGGCIIFDPKGEHVRVTYKRRASWGNAYVVDPFGLVNDLVKTSNWNPLDEIDPNHSDAREQVKNLASASIRIEKGETANSAHFRDNAQIILRGFIAHVLTRFPKENRHLGTVYDLIKTGDPEGKRYSPKGSTKLRIEMLANSEIDGAPRDAADLLQQVSERERGGYLSTIARGIDWMNTRDVREVITKRSHFSLRDAKTKNATIYLVLPENYLETQNRFVASFYSLALDVCDNFVTPQPKGSEKRVLFLFDEFAKLGHFSPAARKITVARSSYLKFWIILQNMGQMDKYENIGDFTGSSDMQFFGLSTTDEVSKDFVHKSLGQYTEKNEDGEIRYDLLPKSEIAEFLDIKSNGQIVIPLQGRPLKLKRSPYYKNYKKSQYGNRNAPS